MASATKSPTLPRLLAAARASMSAYSLLRLGELDARAASSLKRKKKTPREVDELRQAVAAVRRAAKVFQRHYGPKEYHDLLAVGAAHVKLAELALAGDLQASRPADDDGPVQGGLFG